MHCIQSYCHHVECKRITVQFFHYSFSQKSFDLFNCIPEWHSREASKYGRAVDSRKQRQTTICSKTIREAYFRCTIIPFCALCFVSIYHLHFKCHILFATLAQNTFPAILSLSHKYRLRSLCGCVAVAVCAGIFFFVHFVHLNNENIRICNEF